MAEADTFTFACNANESQHSSINVAVSASEQLDQPSRQDLTRSTTSMSMEPDRAGTAHAALLRRRGRFAIVVPSLKSKGDYVEVPEEYFVKEVVRQSGGSNGVTLYQVRLGNEQEVTVRTLLFSCELFSKAGLWPHFTPRATSTCSLLPCVLTDVSTCFRFLTRGS